MTFLGSNLIAFAVWIMTAGLVFGEPFKLATFNTFWLFDTAPPLARWGERLPAGGLDEKIERLAQVIGQIDPDVIALQEIEGELVIELLVAKLNDSGHDFPFWWTSQSLDPFTGQSVAVLSKYRAAIDPIRRLDQTVEEYRNLDNRSKMGSLGKFLRVDIEIGDEVISLYVIHLKSRRGGTE